MPHLQTGMDNNHPVEIYYEDHGQGQPVVLIHGWPLSGRSWEPQIPALIESGYRVITYDRRGFGWSSQPWNGYDYDTFANDLHVLIEHLDLQNLILVGFSMGGGEVARYVGIHGTQRVSKAVFAAAVPPFLYKSPEHPEGGIDDAAIAQFQQAAITDRISFLDTFTKQFFAAGEKTELVSEPFRLYNRDIAAFASPKGTVDCIAAFSTTDFRSDLATFNLPTLIIHGDSDAIVPFEVSGKLTHESIPNSHLVLIEGGSHGLNATHTEQFNSALIRFLNA